MEKSIEKCSNKIGSNAPPTVGIIVIGDEVLKGHVQDTNSHFFCQQLWKLGLCVKKTVVVGDDLQAVADEVRAFSKMYDYVLTSGGIGPTHDDVTMEAIGLAFDEEMVQLPDMMKALFGDKTPSPDNVWIKMAIAPKSTTVINGDSSENMFVCPLMVVRNVYPFPGVPSGLRDTFIANKHLFVTSCTGVFYLKDVFFTINEDQLTVPLRMLQEEFKDSVDIGSYPTDNTLLLYAVKVSLEGRTREAVEKCYCRLLLMTGNDSVHKVTSSYEESEEDSFTRHFISWLCGYMDSTQQAVIPFELCQRLKNTVEVVEEALKRYSFDDICVAFNGGKDCTVLVHIFHAVVMRKWRQNNGMSPCKIKALYIAADQPFREVEEFISKCVESYDLDLIKVSGSIQSALSRLKETHPSIKAILMGTRYSDPYSDSLQSFSLTDVFWPQYMRVHAILDWSYHNVWLFLRMFRVKYCPLYDKGYTSLGNSTNTIPNSSLVLDTVVSSGNNNIAVRSEVCYHPAYLLKDETQERAGRNKKLHVKL